MRSNILIGLCLTAGLALSACGTKSDSGESGADGASSNATNNEDSTGADDGNDDGSDGNNDDAADSVSTDPAESGDSSGAGDDSGGPVTVGFIQDPDGGGVSIECDIWAQDCPDNEKCMPWANDGGGSWNATRCSPLDPAPSQPGDECTVEGSGVSGIDNCEISSMCWDVDPETNMGTCVAFCMGSEANPVCEDPNTTCAIANEGTLILCLPNCDPLLQDCAEGQACYPLDDTFACAPDASGDMGLYGEACEFLNVCDPGLFCANADLVPDCAGSSGCCSTFCDLTDPDASTNCPGSAGGQECVPWFEEGQAPPGFDDIGVCGIPA